MSFAVGGASERCRRSPFVCSSSRANYDPRPPIAELFQRSIPQPIILNGCIAPTWARGARLTPSKGLLCCSSSTPSARVLAVSVFQTFPSPAPPLPIAGRTPFNREAFWQALSRSACCAETPPAMQGTPGAPAGRLPSSCGLAADLGQDRTGYASSKSLQPASSADLLAAISRLEPNVIGLDHRSARKAGRALAASSGRCANCSAA